MTMTSIQLMSAAVLTLFQSASTWGLTLKRLAMLATLSFLPAFCSKPCQKNKFKLCHSNRRIKASAKTFTATPT